MRCLGFLEQNQVSCEQPFRGCCFYLLFSVWVKKEGNGGSTFLAQTLLSPFVTYFPFTSRLWYLLENLRGAKREWEPQVAGPDYKVVLGSVLSCGNHVSHDVLPEIHVPEPIFVSSRICSSLALLSFLPSELLSQNLRMGLNLKNYPVQYLLPSTYVYTEDKRGEVTYLREPSSREDWGWNIRNISI